MNSHSNSNGSIKDMEREIDQDRTHFAQTLSALEEKFSPGQIVDQALGYAKRNGGDFSNNLVKTVSNNPIPTILTGIGLAWMAVSQNRNTGGSQYRDSDSYYEPGSYAGTTSTTGSSSSSKLSGAKDGAKEKASGMKNSLSSSADHASERAHALSDNARHSARDMSDRGRQQWERTSTNARSFFQENPLAVGAAAVAIGALIGAALPVSSRERELLGSTGEQAIDRAKSMAKDAKDTATEAGKAGVQAAKDQAKQSKDSKTTSAAH